MVYRVVDRRGFIAAVGHAVGALGVAAGAVTLPVGFFDQRLESRRVAFVHEQIAGPLPTEHVTRRVPPRRAAVTFIAGKKIQKQAGVVKAPLAPPAKPENIPEKLFARLAPKKNLLARRMLITVPRRNRHALDAESRDIVEKLCHFLRRIRPGTRCS